jgi:hypothetical protein
MSFTEIGYMEDDYLSELDYMAGRVDLCVGMQAEMVIQKEDLIGFQAEMKIVDIPLLVGMQAQMILEPQVPTGMQAEMKIEGSFATGFQAEMKIEERPFGFGLQADMKITGNSYPVGMQASMEPLAHVICGGYLDSEDYLSETPYLAPQFCALQGMQAEMAIQDENAVGQQADQKIVSQDDDHLQGMQADQKITGNENVVGMQADMLTVNFTGMQASMNLYNVEQLRFLCSFPSRGTEALGGNNWISVQTVRSGHFSPNNVNTDIFEERTETDGLPGQWELRCDTGAANTFVDTIYIGDHNFSGGATVAFQASDDAGFGSIKYQRNLTVEPLHMYFVLPLADFPPDSARYYRFIIQDGSNPDGSLKIGVIVFGSAVVFTPKETFENPVKFGFRHFKDTIETEGFTNVSNDRAMRKTLSLEFVQLLFDGGNFANLRDYFLESKTDLKCLVIPRPTRPSSLAVFSKLITIPQESHYAISDDNHRIDLTLDYDETE